MPRKPPPEEYRWKKGQSGNPSGLPGYDLIRASLRKILVEPPEIEHKPKTKAEAVALAQVNKSIKRADTFAAGFVTENSEGSLPKTINVNEQMPDVEKVIKENEALLTKHRKQK